MKRFKLLLAALALAGILLPATPALADTNVFKGACENSGSQASAACTSNSTKDPLTGPDGLITNATKLIGFLTGVAAVIVMIVGGFMYVTSSGDSSKVAAARTTIIYAAVGLVVVASSSGIIIFVLNKL